MTNCRLLAFIKMSLDATNMKPRLKWAIWRLMKTIWYGLWRQAKVNRSSISKNICNLKRILLLKYEVIIDFLSPYLHYFWPRPPSAILNIIHSPCSLPHIVWNCPSTPSSFCISICTTPQFHSIEDILCLSGQLWKDSNSMLLLLLLQHLFHQSPCEILYLHRTLTTLISKS